MSESASMIICGDSITSALVVDVAKSLNGIIEITQLWNNEKLSKSRNIIENLCDLLQRHTVDFIIMCSPPLIQLKVIKKVIMKLDKLTRSTDLKSRNPVIVLVPPVSPGYNTSALSDARNLMGIAMPMRKLPSISVLSSHMRCISDPYPVNILRMTSQLPSYWNLGALQSLHIRLNVTNPVHVGQYSWLCEPGLSGGGLLNIYGSGLIDLAYCLTNGLRIASVSCLSRTFDSDINGQLNPTRRITAEDYVVIVAELECRIVDCRGPVAVFMISSDENNFSETRTTSINSCNFLLNIDLSGSNGRLVLPECGQKILWTPSRRKSFERSEINSNGDIEEKILTLNPPKSSFHSNGGFYHSTYTNSDNAEASTSYSRSVSTSASFTVKLTRDHLTEIACISTKKTPIGPCDSSTEESSTNILREAWTRWFIELSSKRNNPNNSKKPLDSLLAPPEHWAYIQRVLLAIEKSTRLHRWVNVATGETL